MTTGIQSPSSHPAPSLSVPSRPMLPGRRLLLLAMGGRFNRHWIFGMANCARRAGIEPVIMELDSIHSALKQDPNSAIGQVNQVLVEQKIGAVISYCMNGVLDLPSGADPKGGFRSFWEVRGIPHLAVWADHPQWAFDLAALRPDLQPAFRSGNIYHFMKSSAHAFEVQRMLGWPNCFELPMAVDPKQLPIAADTEPEFDLVAIYSQARPELQDWCRPFLGQDDPDPVEMMRVIGRDCLARIIKVWETEAPPELHAQLQKLAERLIGYKIANPTSATARHLPRLAEEFPVASWWLVSSYATWFKVSTILYAMRDWQRVFVLAYLARYFKVAVFGGGDWSSLGIHSAAGWVDFPDVPKVIARGRVAINIMPGHDEEGATPKTFEMASGGRPLLHSASRGLEDLFDIGSEIETFTSPKQARLTLETLLRQPQRREEMGQSLRAALETRHNWGVRLHTMFASAGLPMDCFRSRGG